MLQDWLANGTELEKRHARHRLAMFIRSEPVYPSLTRQAGTAVKAMTRFVKSGLKTVDQAEQARRLEICLACEAYDVARKRCRKCGCLTRWKARLASEHCPLPEPKW